MGRDTLRKRLLLCMYALGTNTGLKRVLAGGRDAIDKQYVDNHGQSEVAFASCYLFGFSLMPRLKRIARQKLYLPGVGEDKLYPNLTAILTRPMNWEFIRQQYHEMVKYAAALQKGTAHAESILKRFMRNNLNIYHIRL